VASSATLLETGASRSQAIIASGRKIQGTGIKPRVKPLALLSVVACLTIAAAGCGSSEDSTSSTAAGTGGGTAGDGSAPIAGATETGGGTASGGSTGADQSPPSPRSADSGASGSNSGSAASNPDGSGALSQGSGGPDANDNGARLGSDTSRTGDNSIQTYGSEAEGEAKAAAVAAMRSFALAIADRDYGKVCAGLSSRIRAGLARGPEGCPDLLESLLIIPPAEARRSADATVTEVREGGGNAFVLFRPDGSSQVNYFVMTMEDGMWKSLGLTIGEPLNPSAELPGS
jgi:hypothetical protein